MCLNRLKYFEPPEIGWQVRAREGSHGKFSYFPCCASNTKIHQPKVGMVMEEEGLRCWRNNAVGVIYFYEFYPSLRFAYPVGFHVFCTRAGAEEWRAGFSYQVIWRVRIINPIVTGYQDGRRVVVCEKVQILEGSEF